jgi:hypothetical protein
METHREGERNTEGETLLDLCNRNNWVCGSQLVSQKEKPQANALQLR